MHDLSLVGLVFASSYGRLGRLRKQSIMLGLLSKIGFGRRIGLGGEVGKIAGCARFASKPKKPITTSSCIAVSPFVCGSYSRIGLACMAFIRGNGKVYIFKIGGHLWRSD
jgi:hypothetical protein